MDRGINSFCIFFRGDSKDAKANISFAELLNSIFKIGWEVLYFNETDAWVKII